MDISTKINALFIRACKAKNPSGRVHSVYRRFYMISDRSQCEGYIADILVQICEKHQLLTLTQLINQLSPANEWMYPGETYWQKVCQVLISTIGHTRMDKFSDYPKPLKYRLLLERKNDE